MRQPSKLTIPALCVLYLSLLSACDGDTSSPAAAGSDGSIERLTPAFDALVPADARIEKLAGDFRFTEGPVWDRRNNQLYFSDLIGNAIYTWSDTDGLATFMQPVYEGDSEHTMVGSNGLTLDDQGRLLLLEHGNRVISRLEADGSRTILAERYGDGRLNSPNDSVWHSNGWLYFTDPPYGLAGGDQDPQKELNFSGIYRLYPATGEVQLLASHQSRPNGIGLSPDEQTLYVANSDGNRMAWYQYDVAYDGQLSNRRIFFDATGHEESGAADGLKVDVDGNVFATGPGGVWVFDPAGKHLGTIKPAEVPANVAWGDDGSTLYMTARSGLYRINLATRGKLL